MLHTMLRRFHFLALTLVGTLGLAAGAQAVVVVNDTWKDGTDTDPAFGDANFDDAGGINGHDYLIWQRNAILTGGATNATGDANADANANAADLTIWRSQYGPLDPISYSENGVDRDSDGDIESAWFHGAGEGIGSLNPVGPNGPLRMTAGTSSTSWTTYFKPAGEKIVLANPGDALKVTWTFTLTDVSDSNTSQNFRFGVVDSGTRITTGSGSPPTAAYKGYAIWGNMAETLGNGNPFQLRARTSLDPDTLFNNTDDFGQPLINGATSGTPGYADDVAYTMTWLMTRGTADNLLLDVMMAGGTLGNSDVDTDGIIQATFDDTLPNTFQFDTFGIRPSNAAGTAGIFDTTNFKVEFTPGGTIGAVPEPTAGVLAMLAAGALVRRRRRR